jgi:N-6 DNA Methylase
MEALAPRSPETTLTEWVALSSPSPGSNFTVLVEQTAGEVRQALEAATHAVADAAAYESILVPRVSHLGFTATPDTNQLLAARALTAMWLSAYSLGAVVAGDPFSLSEKWFVGPCGSSLPRLARRGITPPFACLPPPSVVFALLPYLLDALAPGTRRSVMRSPAEQTDRRARKRQGAYYTPGDVARTMVAAVWRRYGDTWLDPACGTGVFLRAALLEADVPLRSLFGIDVDPLVADTCAFVLAAAALARGERWPSPWSVWHVARSRVATMDSLLVTRDACDRAAQLERETEFKRVDALLTAGGVPEPAGDHAATTALGSLFPALRHGADVVISNPPYAQLGARPPFDPASVRFESLSGPPRGTTRIEALFLELASQLAAMGGSVSIVLPLSAAVSGRPEFVGVRRFLQRLPAEVAVSFFDRAPDALFGDDVKTRNIIVTVRADRKSSLRTTGLLRWTSWTRSRFLESIEPCEVRSSIERFVPKIGSRDEAMLFEELSALPSSLGESTAEGRSVEYSMSVSPPSRTVYVSPTAYNWLGCARCASAFIEHGHSSDSALTQLPFASAELADAAFAVVASRFTFWLWTVSCDGFHVTKTFLHDLPFAVHLLRDGQVVRLASVGRDLWAAMRHQPILSVNKGRTTVAFSALVAGELLDQVDEAVAAGFGLKSIGTTQSIRAWHENHVVVDFERRDPVPLLKKG